jgi:hypothetical protein
MEDELAFRARPLLVDPDRVATGASLLVPMIAN